MAVTQVDLRDKRARQEFVLLEEQLLAGAPLAVPEIRSDLDRRLRGDSPFYEEMEHALFIVGGEARCAAFINRRWQRDRDDDAGFIGYFAAAPGALAAAVELFDAAETWLVTHGANRAVAPYNGAAMHGLATRTAAFDEEPMFPFPWQPPHHPGLLEAVGYRPTYPFWTYEVDFSSERYKAASRHATEHARCTVRTFDKRRWNDEVERLRLVFNATFATEWEFHALTNREFHEFLDQIKPVFDPRQWLFAEVDGHTAGFCFGFPDWTPLFRSFDGRMGPLQVLRFLRRAKRFDRAGALAIGVREEFRGRHIGPTLLAALFKHYERLGLPRALYYPVNDDNHASRQLAESFGGQGRVLHHAYDKPLV